MVRARGGVNLPVKVVAVVGPLADASLSWWRVGMETLSFGLIDNHSSLFLSGRLPPAGRFKDKMRAMKKEDRLKETYAA
jgi:hypothetical protein